MAADVIGSCASAVEALARTVIHSSAASLIAVSSMKGVPDTGQASYPETAGRGPRLTHACGSSSGNAYYRLAGLVPQTLAISFPSGGSGGRQRQIHAMDGGGVRGRMSRSWRGRGTNLGDGDPARPGAGPAVPARPGCEGRGDRVDDRVVARGDHRHQRAVPAIGPAARRLRRRHRGTRLCGAALRVGHASRRPGAGPRRVAHRRRRERGHRRRRDQRRPGRHRAFGRRRGHHRARHRPAAAQRPQLHGAGAAGPRQRAGAELRSDQDQLRRHLVGRAAGPRRQHHHRRHGQQRRHGGRAAAQHRPGGRAGVPDRHQPVCRGPWTLGRLGHQRRHPLRRRRVARLRVALLPRRRDAGRAGHGRPQPGSAAVRSPAVRRLDRRAAAEGQPVRVRRRGVPQPGRRDPGGRARHGRPRHPPLVRAGAARRRDGPGARRLAGKRQRPRAVPLLGAERQGRRQQRRRQAASPRRRSVRRHQQVLRAAGHVDARALVAKREQLQRQPERLRQLHRLALDRPAVHVPELGRRLVVPRAAEHRAAPLAVRRHLQLRARLARAARRRRGAAGGCRVRAGRVPGRTRGAGSGLPGVRRQRRRPGERQRPAVCGDAPQRQARSGPEHPRRRQHARGLLHPGRLAACARTSRSISGCATSWTPTSRTSAATTRSTRSCSRSCKAIAAGT